MFSRIFFNFFNYVFFQRIRRHITSALGLLQHFRFFFRENAADEYQLAHLRTPKSSKKYFDVSNSKCFSCSLRPNNGIAARTPQHNSVHAKAEGTMYR